MKPILIDTNAYTALKRGDPEAARIVQHAPSLALNVVILAELLGGFALGTKEAENRAELELFLASPRVTLLPVDRGTAQRYAGLFAALRRAGTPIPTNDLWIAASALQHDQGLFSFDEHFQKVRGLHIGASLAELMR